LVHERRGDGSAAIAVLCHHFYVESPVPEGTEQFVHVLRAAGFEVQLDLRGVHADVPRGPVVPDTVDVRPLAGDNVEEVVQRAGAVLEDGPDAEEAAALDEPVGDDLGEDVEVDVAAAERRHDRLAVVVVEPLLELLDTLEAAGYEVEVLS